MNTGVKIKMTDSWKEAILEHVPHGQEGQINLSWEDAITWAKILNKRGYAVLFTGGDIGDDVKVSWIYAGGTDNIDYADYDSVVFTSMDYIDEYPEAYYKDNDIFDDNEEDTDIPYYIPKSEGWDYLENCADEVSGNE